MWEDLVALIEDNSIDSLGGNAYGIALYGRVASMILDKYAEFDRVGVTGDEMLELLDRIEASLEDIQENMTKSELNRGLGEIAENALKNASNARKQIIVMQGGK